MTGGGGFIGSTLVDRLLADGHEVVVVDSFNDYYDPAQKRRNLAAALEHPTLELREVDLATADLGRIIDGADVLFHQAGQPGVRLSWGSFDRYQRDNTLVTQRILESLREHGGPRLVYASSSSVYGDQPRYPVQESDRPMPVSPYGVTKLAAEHLCVAYARSWAVDAVALRYFTVYGPRQRPDMGIHKLIDAALRGVEFPMFGDGSQRRDFTFVDDVVEANLAAAQAHVPAGTVANIAGGSSVPLAELVALVEDVTGLDIRLARLGGAPGDVRETAADTSLARDVLGWSATVSIEDGIRRQVNWHRSVAQWSGVSRPQQ